MARRFCALLAAAVCLAGAAGAQSDLAQSELTVVPGRSDARSERPAASAAKQPAVPLSEALKRRGDLTLRGNSLNDALMTISELWRINIVAGEVPGAVNGVFKDAPLREILDSILISNGYGYRAVGESLVVSDLAKLGQVNPFFESATIRVQAADINDVVTGAQLLSTPQGQVRPIPSASSVFVLDFPDRVKMIREFADSVDRAALRASGRPVGASVGAGPQQLQVAYLKTHYISAENAVPVLEAVLSTSGRVASMKDEDRLLAVDFAENLQMIATVLQRIDRPRPQVSVRALIYDISLQDKEALGLNWQSLAGGNSSPSIDGASLSAGTITSGSGSLINSLTVAPPAEDAVNGSFSFFTLNSNLNLSAVAVALQEAADSRLLASPNVTVVDNDEATIESVSEIPFQQLTQTGGGGNIGTTAFRDAGVTLKVTPKIAMDGTIEMQVRPEFSRLTGFTSGDNQPIIDRRTAETRVRVASGQTFVIAGLRQRQDVGDFRGVPFLKDVRFFGHLFRGRETDIRESELVVFISPVIVRPDEPLSPRERVTADTVDCRLNLIPQAEGCPAGCTCSACSGRVVEGLEEVVIESSPTVAEPPAPLAAPAQAVPPTRGLTPRDILPPPPGEPTPVGDGPDGLAYPEIGSRPKLRRLPPVEGAGRGVLANRPGRPSPSPRTANKSPMRPAFESRFRASGGAYSGQKRQPAGEETAGEQGGERKGFWDRVLRR
ncbi:MAG: hypothetical protein AAGB00_03600 [Planctomycetota bacterium]